MRGLVRVYCRALAIVTCTALNVTQVAGHHYVAAFFTGGLLSLIWWGNAKAAALSSERGAQAAYGFGAACGTMLGMWLGRLI